MTRDQATPSGHDLIWDSGFGEEGCDQLSGFVLLAAWFRVSVKVTSNVPNLSSPSIDGLIE